MPKHKTPWMPLCGLVLTALSAACGPSGPAYVYVPAPDFKQALVARADLRESGVVAVGEWVTLHANRLFGPWRRVPRGEVPDSAACTRTVEPQSPEIGVETRVEWAMRPEGAAAWNRPSAPDFSRQVRFSKPGTYLLWAVSPGCGREIQSDTVRIEVR
ncbi:MAG TPA: hypothetical protein VFL93_09550 [Longimicrobiaceae bacterium]|nr:hypothetical protein [Longimicrobiaceae bacterium]